MDFIEDRCSGNDHCLFSGDILCTQDHEDETDIESHLGWDSDHAAGAPADSCRILFTSDLQSEAAIWKVPPDKF